MFIGAGYTTGGGGGGGGIGVGTGDAGDTGAAAHGAIATIAALDSILTANLKLRVLVRPPRRSGCPKQIINTADGAARWALAPGLAAL